MSFGGYKEAPGGKCYRFKTKMQKERSWPDRMEMGVMFKMKRAK
jgi:hypothetical protein